MEKKLVFGWVNRLIHSMFIILFPLVWLLSKEAFIYYHSILGVLLGLLALIRITWGFTGDSHSRFSTKLFSFVALKNYFFSFKTFHEQNPAANWSAVLILIGIICVSMSGVLFIATKYHQIKEVHEILAKILLAIVIIHSIGACLSFFMGKDDIQAILTGYKKSVQESVWGRSHSLQGIMLFIIVIAGTFSFYELFNQSLEKEKEFHRQQLPQEYVRSCTECHSLYPANFFTASSWMTLMTNLKNHFGTDASLEEDEEKNITHFLVTESQKNMNRFSKRVQKENLLEVTKTALWKKKHDSIPQEIFAKKMFRPSHCQACHSDANAGFINPANIQFHDMSWSEKMRLYGQILCD